MTIRTNDCVELKLFLPALHCRPGRLIVVETGAMRQGKTAANIRTILNVTSDNSYDNMQKLHLFYLNLK